MTRIRPERQAPPEVFYNDVEAQKYTTSSRIIDIQVKLSARALDLSGFPDDGLPRLLLNISCGSRLSGSTISAHGHQWIGVNISEAMLDVARSTTPNMELKNTNKGEGDLLLIDMGQGLPIRPGSIDGAISISAVQCLCNADKMCDNPRQRLKVFFGSLYKCLAQGARAVFQVYSKNEAQMLMISEAAVQSGFSGKVIVDYPHNTRAKKIYLWLTCGPAALAVLPKAKLAEEVLSEEGKGSSSAGKEEELGTVNMSERQRPVKKQRMDNNNKNNSKGQSWILKKKEQRRQRGFVDVPADSKYTGRKRKPQF